MAIKLCRTLLIEELSDFRMSDVEHRLPYFAACLYLGVLLLAIVANAMDLYGTECLQIVVRELNIL